MRAIVDVLVSSRQKQIPRRPKGGLARDDKLERSRANEKSAAPTDQLWLRQLDKGAEPFYWEAGGEGVGQLVVGGDEVGARVEGEGDVEGVVHGAVECGPRGAPRRSQLLPVRA